MSPRTPEQFEQMREESRDRILEAALAVFARRGYQAATIREISREAGVSQGLMYNYFQGKQELLRAVYERTMRDVRSSLDGLPRGAGRERLDFLVRDAFRVVRAHLDFWRLSYQVRFQPEVATGLGEQVHAWSREILERLESPLRDLGCPDPPAAARVLFAAIDGAAQHYALDPGGYPLERVADEMVARFAVPPPRDPPGEGAQRRAARPSDPRRPRTP